MLAELRIVNFALIEQLSLQFQSGFTVLTGETGAGKSLLIDAIALLVGGRASTDQIRSGEDEAQLEAAFHLPDTHPLLQRLRLHEIIGQNESELILRRVLSRSGRHRVYVNGSLCPQRVLEELGGTLVDIHGQHEQQSLLATAKQLDALDAFGRLFELREGTNRPTRDGKNSARSWMPCRVTTSIVCDVRICCDSRLGRSNKPDCCLMKKSGSVTSGSDWYMRIGSGN